MSPGIGGALAVFAVCGPAVAQVSVTARSTTALADRARDQFGVEFTVAGLSGITYAGMRADGRHRFLCVMDNSDKVVELAVAFAPDGAVVSASMEGGFRLSEARDFEGIAVSAVEGRVLLSEEGTPGVREYELAGGGLTGVWETPAVFLSRRANFGFESLARRGATAWTCNEEALTVDGPLSTQSNGSLVRLLRYDGGVPGAEYAYRTEPVHGIVINGSRSGVSDMVTLPGGGVLTMERSLALASPLFLTRIFEVGFEGATDVRGVAALQGAVFTPVHKRLVHSGGYTNLEGLCLGPRLAGGGYALVGVVDDADPVSVNALVAFELHGVGACAADWDGSGAIDSGDFFAFLGDFFAGDADFDANGITDSRDFFAFLGAWFGGC